MELQFSKVVDKKNKVASMFIYDLLGLKDEETGRFFNGHDFARELRYLDEYYDEIEIHINSEGGVVDHGLSIISAMIDVEAKITTINDGVCASMAAMILLNGDVVKVKDFAKTMLHKVSLINAKGEVVKNPSKKQSVGIDMANDTLNRLLKRRGKSDEEAQAIVTKDDHWMKPEELQSEGLIDEIIGTERKNELAALEPSKLVAKLQNEHNFSNTDNMNKVIAKLNALGLNIAEDANEEIVVAALDKLEVGDKSPDKKLIDRFIALGKKTGVVTDGDNSNEEKFRKLADADFDLFVDMLQIDQLGTSAKPADQVRVSELIAKLQGKGGGAADEKDFAWYEKNDPEALVAMEIKEPEKFAALKAADDAKYQ